MKRDPIFDLAEVAVGLQPADLPDEVLKFQKLRLLDNLGTGLAGARWDGADALVNLLMSLRSAPHCRLWGRQQRLAIVDAAFVNSIASRALDLCDVVLPGYHPSSTDVPVAMAVGEWAGRSGLDILAALAIAQEMTLRIYRACPGGFGGFDSNVLAFFASTIVAGRLLELTAPELINALGLALNQTAGTFQNNADGALAVRIVQGLASRAGIECALLAQQGITGPRNVLCGEMGFFQLYAPSTVPDLSQLTADLGRKFEDGRRVTCFKLYPCCSLLLSLTDAALALAHTPGVSTENLLSVDVWISEQQQRICGAPFCSSSNAPATAMFSVQYVVASALTRGAAGLREFSPSAVCDPIVGELARRITYSVDPLYALDQCRVQLTLRDGAVIQADGINGKGWPANPVSEAELRSKLEECVRFSGLDEPERRILEIQDRIARFEAAESNNELLAAVTSGG